MTDNTQPEALRLAKYVARRKLAKQLDANEIHSFDSGCDTEAVLLLSDIEAVLAQAATLTAAQPVAPQADSQPAQVWDYPPLPDFDTVEQHIYGACRRYITQDMLEPIHNLIRETVDADRAAQEGK